MKTRFMIVALALSMVPAVFAAGPIQELYPNHLFFLTDFDAHAHSLINDFQCNRGKPLYADGEGLFGSKALVGGEVGYAMGDGKNKDLVKAGLRMLEAKRPGTVLFWIKLREPLPEGLKYDYGATHFVSLFPDRARLMVFRQDGKSCGFYGVAPMSLYVEYFQKEDGKRLVQRADAHNLKFRVLKVGEWHLVAASYCKDALAISIDGQPFTSVETGFPFNKGDPWYLGFATYSGKDGQPGCCAIDDCAILKFKMSDDQVKELYDEYRARLQESPHVANSPKAELVRTAKSENGRYEIAVKLANPTGQPVELKVDIDAKPVNSQPVAKHESVNLAPGQEKVVTVNGPVLGPEKVVADISVTEVATKRLILRRHRVFAPLAPEPEWMAAPSLVSFKFGYYPYANTIHAAVDVSACDEFEKAKSVRLSVFKVGEKNPVVAKDFPLDANGRAEIFWRNLPELDGEYVCKLEAPGLTGAKAEQKFLRKRFPWEGNRIGLSGTIPAPFTPVEREWTRRPGFTGFFKSKQEHVKVVLRDHTIADSGLWEQVMAAGKPLFARPMAFVGGGQRPSIAVERTWDVDGLCVMTLTLPAGHYKPMALEIPIRGERAPLMHACIDGLRSNYAGKIPDGTGSVWNGSQCKGRNAIVGDYVPYIWVGGALRGLSVFGENDRGWVVGEGSGKKEDGIRKGIPCQEIIRESDGTIVIRLNIVQREVDLKESRTIKLGLQATPVKPMFPNWRSEPHGMLLGACWYWGGFNVCCSIEPFDRTDEFFRHMGESRRTGKFDEDYLKKAVASYPYPEPMGSEAQKETEKSLLAHFRNGLWTAAHQSPTNRLVFYTNGRGVEYGDPLGQGATFCNEWTDLEYINRAFRPTSAEAYDLDPLPSYRDYAAWWYEKMFSTGACDYMYWDDVFLNSNFNLVQTDAYRLPDGRIQPSSGVFTMREMIKRCAVVQAELNKPCQHNWVHMTNTAIAPILAFAGINYDWEDLTGERPHQEKYSKEHILAATIGRQFGNRVGIMGYFSFTMDKNGEKFKWLEHTAVGVMLTHELRWNPGHKEYDEAHKMLCDWGYRTPAVKVWNYFDEDVKFPVEVTGKDVASIVMAKPETKEAMFCVSSFSSADDWVTIRPDAATLGLADGWKAVDAVSGKEIAVKDGVISVPLPKYDWLLLKFK